jgi:cytochrome P450
MSSVILALVAIVTTLIYHRVIEPLFISPLSKIPGPKLYALTKWRLALDEWNGERTRSIEKLHRQYGPVVRIGPSEVHFNSTTALRTIYGAGSAFEKTVFYRIFDAYGKQNLFSFRSSRGHADRRKLLSNIYSKSSVLKAPYAPIVEGKARQYLDYIDAQDSKGAELFRSLHYFALDTVSHVLYGPRFGATSAMTGESSHRAILGDIFDPARRRFIWFALHLNTLTEWMYARPGLVERLLRPFLPMQKPITFTGVREHTLKAWEEFNLAATNDNLGMGEDGTIASLLFKHYVNPQSRRLEGIEIASECSDHLLGGLDTTANTLMFLIWALSLQKNKKYQEKLIEEVCGLPEGSRYEDFVVSVAIADKLVYVNAVIKEALRLYAPIQATLPRSSRLDTTIDGYIVPARTVVGISPYSLHRNEQVFDEPLEFNPERWLTQDASKAKMDKWFWAFASGSNLCIGKNLVLAEMTALITAIYRKYTTSIIPGFENLTPVVTSRFEIFYDETMPRMKNVSVVLYLLFFLPANTEYRSTNVGLTSRSILLNYTYKRYYIYIYTKLLTGIPEGFCPILICFPSSPRAFVAASTTLIPRYGSFRVFTQIT